MAYKKKSEVSEDNGKPEPLGPTGFGGGSVGSSWINGDFARVNRTSSIQNIATEFMKAWLLSPKEGKFFDGLGQRAVEVAADIVDRSEKA